MAQIVVNLSAAGVADMLAHPASLAAWEVARRLARAVTASELAGILATDLATVQRSLDWLEEFGLLVRLPMRANRRVPTYRSAAESIVVMFDPADAMSQAWIERAVAAARDQVSRQLARCAAIGRHGTDPWTFNRHCSVHLDAGDLEEFRRLMAEVTGFLEAAQAPVEWDTIVIGEQAYRDGHLSGIPLAEVTNGPDPDGLLATRHRMGPEPELFARLGHHGTALAHRVVVCGVWLQSGDRHRVIGHCGGVGRMERK